MFYTTTHTAQNFTEVEPIPEVTPGFSLQYTINECCFIFGVHRSLMYQKNRSEKVKFCRWAIWYFARKYGGLSYKLCGLITAPAIYDHTTVHHALKKLPQDMLQFPWLKEAINEIEKIF